MITPFDIFLSAAVAITTDPDYEEKFWGACGYYSALAVIKRAQAHLGIRGTKEDTKMAEFFPEEAAQ